MPPHTHQHNRLSRTINHIHTAVALVKYTTHMTYNKADLIYATLAFTNPFAWCLCCSLLVASDGVRWSAAQKGAAASATFRYFLVVWVIFILTDGHFSSINHTERVGAIFLWYAKGYNIIMAPRTTAVQVHLDSCFNPKDASVLVVLFSHHDP